MHILHFKCLINLTYITAGILFLFCLINAGYMQYLPLQIYLFLSAWQFTLVSWGWGVFPHSAARSRSGWKARYAVWTMRKPTPCTDIQIKQMSWADGCQLITHLSLHAWKIKYVSHALMLSNTHPCWSYSKSIFLFLQLWRKITFGKNVNKHVPI